MTDDRVICSAKGCQVDARWDLLWNNPKIHTPERRKVWLSCDDHRDHLENFLNLRGFMKSVVSVDELPRIPEPETT